MRVGTRLNISGIRLSDEERAAIIRSTGQGQESERRDERRVPLRQDFALMVRLWTPGGDPTAFRATPRDLSPSGIGFFHAAYIHAGTTAEFVMRGRDGGPVSILGKVIRCRHLSGRVHEVGAVFDHKVEVQVFVDDTRAGLEDGADNGAGVADWNMAAAKLAAEIKGLSDSKAPAKMLLAKVHELQSLLVEVCSKQGE